jgi:hypothetical protein
MGVFGPSLLIESTDSMIVHFCLVRFANHSARFIIIAIMLT